MAGSTSITHIIGTTSVILLFFVVGSYYNGYFTELNVEAYKAQLGQVAEYYAANMNDLVVLGSLTENSVFLSKEVVTPSSIGERIYNISLTKMTSSDGDKQVFSVVVSIDSLNIFAIADMVWSPNLNIQLYTNQAITGNGTVTLQRSIVSNEPATVRGRTGHPASGVVWCSKAGASMILGLGIKEVT